MLLIASWYAYSVLLTFRIQYLFCKLVSVTGSFVAVAPPFVLFFCFVNSQGGKYYVLQLLFFLGSVGFCLSLALETLTCYLISIFSLFITAYHFVCCKLIINF